jgi:hypothetical protein
MNSIAIKSHENIEGGIRLFHSELVNLLVEGEERAEFGGTCE